MANSIGQTMYYKTSPNGIDVYTSLPWGGNVPYGYTPISKEDYVAGLQGKIKTAQDFLTKYPNESWKNSGYIGETYNQNSVNEYQKLIDQANTADPNYVDPSLAKFQANAPTTSEQYYTPEYFSTLAPSEQQRLKNLYPNSYGSNPISTLESNQKEVKLGNTYGVVTAPGSQSNNAGATPANTNTNNTNTSANNNGGSTATTTMPVISYGASGDAVKLLQTQLGGLEVDGQFGPKTQAAVKAYQASHGLQVDGIVGPQTWASLQGSGNKSDVNNVGAGASNNAGATGTIPNTKLPSTGNATIDALLQKFENQSPQTSFTDIYKAVYTSLGLDTMNADYKAQTQAYADLQTKKEEEKAKVSENPWISEALRTKELAAIDTKYQAQENILTNKLKLLETNISSARSDAQYITGQMMDQLNQSSKLNEDIIMKAIDVAEKQAELDAKTYNTGSGAPTSYKNVAIYTNLLKTGKDSAGNVIGKPQGSDGFVDPYVYLSALDSWNGTLSEFLSKFPIKLVNPLSYHLLPESIRLTSSIRNLPGE